MHEKKWRFWLRGESSSSILKTVHELEQIKVGRLLLGHYVHHSKESFQTTPASYMYCSHTKETIGWNLEVTEAIEEV